MTDRERLSSWLAKVPYQVMLNRAATDAKTALLFMECGGDDLVTPDMHDAIDFVVNAASSAGVISKNASQSEIAELCHIICLETKAM